MLTSRTRSSRTTFIIVGLSLTAGALGLAACGEDDGGPALGNKAAFVADSHHPVLELVDEWMEAFLARDCETITSIHHPDALAVAGGRDRVIEHCEGEGLAATQFDFGEITYERVSVATYGDDTVVVNLTMVTDSHVVWSEEFPFELHDGEWKLDRVPPTS